MKIGDLVRHSQFHKLWQLANEWNYEPHRNLGMIVDKNPHRYFVYWFEDSSMLAHPEEDLEVISESR